VEGTPLFMPPEMFSSDKLSADPFAADVWSLGVTMFMLLFGQAPFTGSNFLEISESVRNDNLIFPLRSSRGSAIGDGWQALLQGMLRKEPAKRLTLKQIKKHPAIAEEVGVTEDEIRHATRISPKIVVDPHDDQGARLAHTSLSASVVSRPEGAEKLFFPKTPTAPKCARRSVRVSAFAESGTQAPLETPAAVSVTAVGVSDRLSLDASGSTNFTDMRLGISGVLGHSSLSVSDCRELSDTAVPGRLSSTSRSIGSTRRLSGSGSGGGAMMALEPSPPRSDPKKLPGHAGEILP
jgi:serine/threonine protein kinase